MIVAVPVTPEGLVDHSWGKAEQVAVAKVSGNEIDSWEVHDVGWREKHDLGAHGRHHARIVRFLLANQVEVVVIDHAGAPMINTLRKMGLKIVLDAAGPAREAVLAAAATS